MERFILCLRDQVQWTVYIDYDTTAEVSKTVQQPVIPTRDGFSCVITNSISVLIKKQSEQVNWYLKYIKLILLKHYLAKLTVSTVLPSLDHMVAIC